MKFTPIDLQSWKRGQMFYYFSNIAPTGYSITVNIDVTELRKIMKREKMKFFPAYLWLVTKNLNRQEEFKIAEKDGVIGIYDNLTPLYATFHEDDHTFSLMWTKFSESFSQFYQDYIENQQRFGDVHGVISQPQTPPPENAYTVSCVPWIDFTHFAVHSYENKPYYFPSVEAGQFFEKGGRLLMPLSITCHHATTDGYHIKCFLENLQEDINEFQRYL
ncbi:MAG: chloramphenicol acetyltransferase CAT [Clostridiales bacterium]|nr:chloramphenicol acetyltransferase CAT [Clostridiales bacterium]